jgi:hypothetical protein
MTIVICDMQYEDIDIQCDTWCKLKKMMVKNGVLNPNFKDFMANIAQANWNIMWIVYGSGDPSEPTIDMEQTWCFH